MIPLSSFLEEEAESEDSQSTPLLFIFAPPLNPPCYCECVSFDQEKVVYERANENSLREKKSYPHFFFALTEMLKRCNTLL